MQLKKELYEYNELFDYFTKFTSEKQKLANVLFEFLPTKREKYLDIGAGNGELMALLKNGFKNSVAIESDKEFSKKLELITNNIIWGKIEDVEIIDKYDFILASHVLGYIPSKWKYHVINKVYKKLNDNGVLVFVYNSINSDIYQILNIIKKETGIRSNYSKTTINKSKLEECIPSPFVVLDKKLPIHCETEYCIKELIHFIAFDDLEKVTNKYEIMNNIIDHFKMKFNLWTINVIHEFLVISNDLSLINNIENNNILIQKS